MVTSSIRTLTVAHGLNYLVLQIALLQTQALPPWNSAGWKFTGHVWLMSTAAVACFQTSVALIALRHHGQTLQRGQLHGILNVVTAVLAILGFASIWMHKDSFEKPHIQTWHSIAGIISLTLLGFNVLQVSPHQLNKLVDSPIGHTYLFMQIRRL